MDSGTISGPAVKTGVSVRVGLVWRGDPGMAVVSASSDYFGMVMYYGDHARELREDGLTYTTTEWFTVRVEGPYGYDTVMLNYGTFR